MRLRTRTEQRENEREGRVGAKKKKKKKKGSEIKSQRFIRTTREYKRAGMYEYISAH